jgi:hypothetical protein
VPAEIWEFADPRHRRAELTGFTAQALDGAVGTVRRTTHAHEASFLAVERAGRDALVVPAGLVERVDDERRVVYLDRTVEELEAAPDLDADSPPSRADVLRLVEHYGPRSPRSLGVGLRKVSRLPN